MSRKRARRKPYDRALLDPIVLAPKITPCVMPDEALLQRLGPESAQLLESYLCWARERDSDNHVREFKEWWGKILRLFEHFALDIAMPGSERDLALSLARRHEPEFLDGATVNYGALFEKYGIDPLADRADLLLAFELAQAHIIRWAHPAPRKSRFETTELTTLVIAIAVISKGVGAHRGDPKARRVARILCDDTLLRKLVPESAAEAIRLSLARRGNKGRARQGPEGVLSQLTIEKTYIPDLWDAQRAVVEGRANAFQKQIVYDVLPYLDSQGMARQSG